MPGQSFDIVSVRWSHVVISVVLLIGCHKPNTFPPDHPVYFDNLFHRLDSLNLPIARCFEIVDSVRDHYPAIGVEDRIRCLDYKGAYYFMQVHDLAVSMQYVDSCLQLLSTPEAQARYPRRYVKCLIDKAENYQLENNYENAFYYYRKGLEAMRVVQDSCMMAEYTQRIAMASFRARRYADARNLFEVALHQFASCGIDFRSFAYQQSNLDNIGESYAAMGKWDSAGYYFDSTLAFIGREGQYYQRDSSHRGYIETARAVVYGNLGDCSLNRGDTARAWQLYQSSISLNMRPLHDSGNALIVLGKLARLQLARGRMDDARRALAELRASLDHHEDADLDLAWRRLHAEWLAQSGDLPGAWKALTAWTALKDSLYAAGNPVANADIPSELVHLEDRYTIQLLKERDQVKTGFLLLALLIVLMLAVIVFLILWAGRKSKSHIRQLNRLNKALRTENRQTQTAINALNEDQAMYLRSLKTIAHDLRNPVGAISSAVGLLRQQSNGNDKMLSLIQQAADQSLHLVDGIMHLDLPMGTLKLEALDLAKLLESCVATLQFKAAEKKQTILLEAGPVSLRADHDKLWRVIINLVDNAIKFSPEGSEIGINMQREGAHAVICVCDHGIGIPKDMEARLFSVDGVKKRKGTAGEASFGLGLAIVSQIIRAHGGTIGVRSEEGKGACFRIELPV